MASHSYLNLPAICYQPCAPQPVAEPQWVAFNTELAEELNLPRDYWLTDEGLKLFSGNQLPDWVKPVAQAYAGHQFGHFNPQLGDGRAVLLCELASEKSPRLDIQLKGSGITPYSRGGDGRSPLGPVLREYLVSEFMHRMGVPTTRALAAVASGEAVYRENAEPGGILTRVANSHIRVGSFQFVMAHSDIDALQALADYSIERHYPSLMEISDEDSTQLISEGHSGNRYLALLDNVIEQHARLVADWMRLGFIHGVMNTDNTSISGETIDYGPCAFMENYQANQVFSFIDKQGRYAYNQQPQIAQWNMARFAETLLPLIDNNKETSVNLATQLVHSLPGRFEKYWLERMGKKLGLQAPNTADKPLIEAFLQILERNQVDFTLAFRLLSDEVNNQDEANSLYTGEADFALWRNEWQQRLRSQAQLSESDIKNSMDAVNPRRIPRNHLIQEVIDAAYSEGDLRPLQNLQAALNAPFTESTDEFDQPANSVNRITTTFCGT